MKKTKDMMKRIENIGQLIADLDNVAIVCVMNELNFDQKKFSSNISWEQIRDMITERYNRSQRDLFDVEEAVLSVSDVHTVVFTDEIIADIRERVKEWLFPLETILDHFNYSHIIDYIDESITMDLDNYPDFSRRLGIQEDLLYEYKINSFFFYQFEAKILRLYHLIERNNSIERIKESINSK